MGLNVRKFVVGLAALSVLTGAFLLYMHVNRMPPIVVEVAKTVPEPADVNVGDSPEPVGKIHEVGIGTIRNTDFIHRDGTGRIDRRIGFEELLHEQGDQWELAKPYMDVFFPGASCQVTADRGRVRVDTRLRQPTLTEAVFTGNVVLHITPGDPNNPWECFIHLDDVGFLAEKSLFSSTGAVRFLSRSVRLTGTGMELIYDLPRNRLELFRVLDLESLRFRSSDVKALADGGRSRSRRRSDGLPVGQEPETTASAEAIPGQPPIPADSNVPPADVYRCVFRRNVRLDSPDGVAVAQDLLSINNIRWSSANRLASSAGQTADPNGEESDALPAPRALNTAVSSHLAMSSISEELYDVVVTCDGGADITLADGVKAATEVPGVDRPAGAAVDVVSQGTAPAAGQYLMARRVDYDFLTNDATMLGPVAMRVLVDPNALKGKADSGPMPALVTAQGSGRFLAAAKRIVLDGGTTGTLRRSEPNAVDEYRVAAPRLILDLAVEPNTADEVKVDVRRILADGGAEFSDANGPGDTPVVTVRMRRQAAGQDLAWVTLDACELQYDTDPDRFSALGPGNIWLHNAVTIQSKTDPNRTLPPCYARLSNFDTLKYWSLTRKIVAEDDAEQLVLDYFPLVAGKDGPRTGIVAGHIEATLEEVAKGRMDLASLVASRGIEYDSEADHLNFVGSEMVYDRGGSQITIRGDDVRPCYMNGVLVDKILMNPRTGQIEAVPVTSIFPVGP